MSKFLVDTKPRVATCNRCSKVVLAAMAGGCRAAVDVIPLDFQQMRGQLIAGREMYRLYIQNGRPTRLELVHVTLLKNPAAKYGTYATSHGCGCHAMDATAFEEVQEGPTRAPAAAQEGSGDSRVGYVTQHRSEGLPAVRCQHCKGLISVGDPDRIMIEWPVWQENVHYVRNRGVRKGYERTYKGWGVERWSVHSGRCP